LAVLHVRHHELRVDRPESDVSETVFVVSDVLLVGCNSYNTFLGSAQRLSDDAGTRCINRQRAAHARASRLPQSTR
jgi:hypothetical protein